MNWLKSKHLETRMQQRALTSHQIEVTLAYGHEYGNAYVLTDADIDEALHSRRQEIKDLERLKRKTFTVICKGSNAITAYRNTNAKRLGQL